MAKNTFKIISLISMIASALFVVINIIMKNKTWYANDATCSGACGIFSIAALIFTILGFILAIVLNSKANKDAEIEGKKIIKSAITINLILFLVWLINYFGILLPARTL